MNKFERRLNFTLANDSALMPVSGRGLRAAGTTSQLPLYGNRTAVIYACVAGLDNYRACYQRFFSPTGTTTISTPGRYNSHTCCSHHPETRIFVCLTAATFASIAENLQFYTIHNLDDLWFWRLIGLLSTAGLAAYYLLIVSLGRPPTWLNALLSIALFTLPTMQFQAIWPSMYTMWTPPILLSLVAAQLLLKASEGDFFANRQGAASGGTLHD